MEASDEILVRAVRTQQGDNIDVYAFFLRGADVRRIADITRLERQDDKLVGFQRKEIQAHVKGIADYLDGSVSVLFPNAIILALSPEVKFSENRGPAPKNLVDVASGGTLRIPILPEGERVAWVVDGQQRTLALAQAKNSDIAVPVVAFVSSDLELQRTQFILVNKARPLPKRLITELLPEVGTLLPRNLAEDRVPSELCGLLNTDPNSPFHRMMRRPSSKKGDQSVIVDSAVTHTIKGSMKTPMGALHQFKSADGMYDADAMYRVLVMFWSEVKRAFPNAWGKAPGESRLMHSAGIRAIGATMDPIMLRADSTPNPVKEVGEALQRLAPRCAWTDGEWEGLGLKWNELEATPQSIARLAEHLVRLDRDLSRPSK